MDKLYTEIIVGTNEEFILSYKIVYSKETSSYILEQSFSSHSHLGSIRQVAVSGKYLVSGGTDELIRIFNLNRKREEGTIIEHEGTVRCLQFHGSSHLFSASEDHKICVFKKGNWKCEKTLKGHKAPVTGIAVHPSGKMALSCCKDQKLITWNLIKGRRAYVTNLNKVADSVYWSPDGNKYLVVADSKIDIYELSTASITHTADFKERVNAVLFINDDIILVGGEGHNLCLYDISKKEEIQQWPAHTNRVKCLHSLTTENEDGIQFISASSDGFIKIWKLQTSNLTKVPELIGKVNTSCRIICMTVYYPPKPNTKTIQNQEEVNPELKVEDSASEDETSSEEENIEIVRCKELVSEAKKRTKKHFDKIKRQKC